MTEQDTICAVATAPGEGAVGMVRLSGPRALDLARQVTGKDLAPRRMEAATLRDPTRGERVDRVLCCFMPGPGSYTGEDVVEVYTHGGTLNLRRVLRLLLTLGARLASPGEFTRRAFLNGRLDLTQAEAVAQIVAARSDRALRNAQAILGGALGAKVRALQDQLVQLSGLLEASVDFAEDTAGEVHGGELQRRHDEVERAIAALAATFDSGRRLDGVTVALVGPVNAGKSSLFNRLLGVERAIVAEEPGTTRDYLEAEVDWDGHRVTLVDTAGERPAGRSTALERAGRSLAAPVVAACDLLVHVFDVAAGQPPDRSVAGGVPSVVAANKVDLVSEGGPYDLDTLAATLQLPVLGTSATEGIGLEELKRSILVRLFGEAQDDGMETVQVAQRRQWERLMQAKAEVHNGRSALEQGLPPEVVVEHCRSALQALGQVTGENPTEAVLDAVFARFCVGK